MRDHLEGMDGDIYTFAENDGPLHSSVDDLTIQRDSLEAQPWFHGRISRTEAEKRVRGNGVFLVRESASKDGGFVVTTKWNGRHHNVLIKTVHEPTTGRVEYKFELEHKFSTVAQLIKFYVENQLPFAERSEAALYRPAAVPSSTGKGVVDTRGASMLVQNTLSPSSRDSTCERMHRFGSQVVLSEDDKFSGNVGGRLGSSGAGGGSATTAPQPFTADLRACNKAAYKVQSLFELNRKTSRDELQEAGSAGVSKFASLQRHPGPVPSRRPGGGSSGSNRSSAASTNSSYLSGGSGLIDSIAEGEGTLPGWSGGRRQPNISKGRYLEMVHKVQVPIHNRDLWEETTPPTPTPSNDSGPSFSSTTLSGCTNPPSEPDEDMIYVDMSSSRPRPATMPLTVVPPTLPPNLLDSPEFDVYGLPITPTPATQPANCDKIANWDIDYDFLGSWLRQISASTIDWHLTNHVAALRYDVAGIEKLIDPAVWERLRVALLSEQPMVLAEHLVLENASFLLLKHWNRDRDPVPGIRHGFHLVLLPDAKGFREDIQERYFILTRFIIASLVTEMNRKTRVRLLKLWLEVGDSLLTVYRDYFSLHALLNAIFSPQVSFLTKTLSDLHEEARLSSLYKELATVHEQGSVARTALATCVPDLGRFVQIYTSSPPPFSSSSSSESKVERGEILSQLLADLDTQMLALLSAQGWQQFRERIWLEEITAEKTENPRWAELFRIETLMMLLWGPKDLDPTTKLQLHSKVDLVLTKFAERTELLADNQ